MVNFVTAVKSVSVKGKRRKLKGRVKEDVVRAALMKRVNVEKPVLAQRARINPLKVELSVSDVVEISAKRRTQELTSRLDFSGTWAPWSAIGRMLDRSVGLN